MKIRLLMVGRGGCPWADAAVEDYARRLRRYGGFEEDAVKPEAFRGDLETVRQAEGERLIRRLGARERLVALDERGDVLDTPGFTRFVEEARLSGTPALTFAIGGAYGLSPEVRERAARVLRLSSMVLNHEVARVVLVEQIYRAMAAIHGVPYGH